MMKRTFLPFCVLLLTLLSACAPAPVQSSSDPPPGASQQPPASNSPSTPDSSLNSAETLAPAPRLTQEDMDQAIQQVMENYSATALSVAVVERGEVTQCGAWGWAVQDQRPMTADTAVRIASISKVVEGMAAMKLAQDGILDLDAPLSSYWGERVQNPYSLRQPSPRSLMTHSSTLKDLEMTRGLDRLTSILSRTSSWRDREPDRADSWAYSNFGMCIFGTTLELASGQLLDDYLQAQFFGPLDINASFHAARLSPEQLANLYEPKGVLCRSIQTQIIQPVPTEIGMGATYYAGGLTISARDMAKLLAVLCGDGTYQGTQYLLPQTVAAMETPQFTVPNGEYTPFQQCLVLRRQDGLWGQSQLCYHTGSGYGVYSLMSYNPETGNGVVVITTGAYWNVNEHGLYALCSDLSEALYQRMETAL